MTFSIKYFKRKLRQIRDLDKNKVKKNGNLFIEQLLVFPFLVIAVWLIIQLILFSYSNSQMNTVANDVSTTIAHHLRGNPSLVEVKTTSENTTELLSLEEALGESDFDGGILGALKNEALNRSYNVLSTNAFIDYTTKNGTKMDRAEFLESGDISFVGNPTQCETALKNNQKVMCAYFQIDDSGDGNLSNFQVVVRMKAPFNVIGNFLAFLGDGADFNVFNVYGNSSAPIDMPGRFQYYN